MTIGRVDQIPHRGVAQRLDECAIQIPLKTEKALGSE
jgi:hypothetical protein